MSAVLIGNSDIPTPEYVPTDVPQGYAHLPIYPTQDDMQPADMQGSTGAKGCAPTFSPPTQWSQYGMETRTRCVGIYSEAQR